MRSLTVSEQAKLDRTAAALRTLAYLSETGWPIPAGRSDLVMDRVARWATLAMPASSTIAFSLTPLPIGWAGSSPPARRGLVGRAAPAGGPARGGGPGGARSSLPGGRGGAARGGRPAPAAGGGGGPPPPPPPERFPGGGRGKGSRRSM